jgi:hypothetical protein
MIPSFALVACCGRLVLLTSLNSYHTLCLTSSAVNDDGRFSRVPSAGPGSAVRVHSAASQGPSKARISESTQTETSGAPGASLARIHTQYRACLVTKFCKTLSLLSTFPPLARGTPLRTKAACLAPRLFFRVGISAESRKNSHSLWCRYPVRASKRRS